MILLQRQSSKSASFQNLHTGIIQLIQITRIVFSSLNFPSLSSFFILEKLQIEKVQRKRKGPEIEKDGEQSSLFIAFVCMKLC